jgi:hypothetical protein
MGEENYFFVNGQRGFDPSAGGLWSHWPVPAAHVLMHNQEWAALRVLTCLVTHLGYGKSADRAWPTIKTISKETGMGKASIQTGIKSLILYGFIVKHKVRKGRYLSNEYQILAACYKCQHMNAHAEKRLPSWLVRFVTNNADNKLQITTAINSAEIIDLQEGGNSDPEDPFFDW